MAPKKQAQIVPEGYFGGYVKPQQLGTWETIQNGIYNRENNTIFGRTPTNWGAILIFYTIFYILLATMFSICMYGLIRSTKSDEPSYKLSDSLIGSNPGLGYRPYPEKFEEDGSVIWYQARNADNVANWTKSINNFLNVYTDPSAEGYKDRVECDFNKPAPPGKICDVPVDTFGPCTKKDNYSYDKSAPCIFIKLNRIYNWVPEYYTKNDIPESADDDLKKVIQESKDNEMLIWISCVGVDPVDRENIGPIAYYPRQGLASYYYPYTNTKGYLSPLVAVQFKRPQPGVLLKVECRAWAKNINYARSRQHAEGSVHFELLVDE